MTVLLGRHKISDFKSIDTSTAWTDFSIALSNCPAFHGIYPKAGPSWAGGSGVNPNGSNKLTSKGTLVNNTLTIRPDSLGNAIDPARGLLRIDPDMPGKLAAATGVGVQIAAPSGTPVELGRNFSAGQPLQNASASYSIPLRARYVQTAAKTTHGPANSSAAFTLIYQ